MNFSHRTSPSDAPRIADAVTGIDVLSRSEHTRVVRLVSPEGGTVIVKHAQTPTSLRRLRQEAAMLRRLAGLDGVVQRADAQEVSDTLVLRDDGGIAMSQCVPATGMPIADVLHLGAALARVLAAVHGAGVVHKDINPSNVLLVGPERRPVLIDFNIASSFAEEMPGFTHQNEIAGTLAYMAPEQTGRTGRVVEQRADLYSLGATLYEMACGHPPFQSGDALQLIHDHLVRTPVPLTERRGDVPPMLSDAVMRLLEKEPDRRYQSAQGLADDLTRIAERLAQGDVRPFVLGERDFAARLAPPSRLIGRDAEIAQLHAALDSSLDGSVRALLVTGAPGVGKTALINELRPAVTARRGWYVSGKFDQTRRDTSASAVLQAMRALGRLLLSQPEVELIDLRERLLRALGPNAGLVAGVLPEFAALLSLTPEAPTGDPLVAEARLFQGGVDLLRVIASPERPVVMVADDLHWTGPGSVKFFDALLADEELRGLLVVGSYREAEVDEAHPLTPMLARWQQQSRPPMRLALSNLPPADLSEMLAHMLRLDPARAAELGQALGERTSGNPFDSVELVNALRLDGALSLTDQGWQWQADDVRRYVGQGDVLDLINRRIDRLAPGARSLLESMACLSGEVEAALLQAALGLSASAFDADVEPALDDGLLVMESNGTEGGRVRFRHDRVQQAAYARLDDARPQAHLALARRLAPVPRWAGVAAEQYLLVMDYLSDEAECRHVAVLFEQVAVAAMRINYPLAERLFASAVVLLCRVDTPASDPALLGLRTQHVSTLYGLGRHEELDRVYQNIEAGCTDPHQLTEAAGLRITSLTSRGRQADAVALGMALLRPITTRLLGRDDDIQAEGWAELERWVDRLDLAADLARPEVSDPHVLAAADLLHRTAPATYFCGPTVLAEAVFQAQRLWALHGPCPGLMSPLGLAPVVAISLHRNYRAGYAMTLHMQKVGEARGYEPHTAHTRNTLPTFAQHWFEPLENGLGQLKQSREVLLQSGSLLTACFSYSATLVLLVDCSPSLDAVAIELHAATELGVRANNAHASATYLAFRQLLASLRGETREPGSFDDNGFDEAAHLAGPGAHPVPGSAYHVNRALAAAIFGDADRLTRHAAVALRLAATQSNYRAVPAHLLQALAMAQQLQAAGEKPPGSNELAASLHTLDVCQAWFAGRAADHAGNYLHLLRWVEAERAWALGDLWTAATLFEAARREVAGQRRPWHLALMTERCARFHLAQGLEPFGLQLMTDARDVYQAWGASAKVALLEDEFAHTRPHTRPGSAPGTRTHGSSTNMSAEQIDMVAILRASQALSSETSLQRLQDRVKALLGTLTGATHVSLVLRGEDDQDWFVSEAADGVTDGETGRAGEQGAATPVEAAGQNGQLSLSAFRYVQRMREPLLVEDAVLDDRFANDRCFASVDRCSLLVVPILSQGELRAVLLLENRQSRGAFSADRLDAVMLIAGQLAVSLDNAMLYASLERKVAERTEALAQANQRLELLAVTDSLTGLANRRRFVEMLDNEWKRGLRQGTSIGLAMIDIDQFKLYNDHYGHPTGDACLRRVASCLSGGLRMVADLAARYGGEEFVLVLPNTDLHGTRTVAERLRGDLAALAEPHAQSQHGIVTISVGITAFVPSDHTTAAQFIEAADAALYEAKRAGRNRVHGPSG
jgi:diguanylate cyclase (GGDEF)-like protein